MTLLPFTVKFPDGEFAGRCDRLRYAVGIVQTINQPGTSIWLGERKLWIDGHEWTDEGVKLPTARQDRIWVESEVGRRSLSN